MRSFLRLHQSGKARFLQGGSGLVLINPDQIQTIFPRHPRCGSVIYFIGEDDGLQVDEPLEDLHKRINVLS